LSNQSSRVLIVSMALTNNLSMPDDESSKDHCTSLRTVH